MSNFNSKEYYEIIKPILKSYEFQKRKEYDHHENESVYIHCLKVSKEAYKMARKLNLDAKSVAIGALLHDFYLEPWQVKGVLADKKSKNIFKGHGFAHAKEAMNNSKEHYPKYMNKKIENMILRHMFPLNIIPPKYIESWVVTIADKKVSLNIFKNPKGIPKYLGLKNIKNKGRK